MGRRLAGVFGVFLTLGALGFGLVMFGRPNLEVVSDTVSHSFGRAFVTGLLGQILVLPTFGMLIVGLILSVAGILLLPFASRCTRCWWWSARSAGSSRWRTPWARPTPGAGWRSGA